MSKLTERMRTEPILPFSEGNGTGTKNQFSERNGTEGEPIPKEHGNARLRTLKQYCFLY